MSIDETTKIELAETESPAGVSDSSIDGSFVDHAGERFYVIRNVDKMPSFFMSLISSSDHWMFLSSTGGLTAGRVSAESAIFPYLPVDKIHESAPHTGSKTVLRIRLNNFWSVWEPFAAESHSRYRIRENLYKSVLGNKVMFEQVNENLGLTFRYTWMVSNEFGFVRECELINESENDIHVELIDGLQNLNPANVGKDLQANFSNLVDAYRWNELDQQTGLALFTVYSCIRDKALPCESLRANTVFCNGLHDTRTLISTDQLPSFYAGKQVKDELNKRGKRGAYFVNAGFELGRNATKKWSIVCDSSLSQSDVVDLKVKLADSEKVADQINTSIRENARTLERIMASADGFQSCAEENVSAHHYANVLFNVLRGGVMDDQYQITRNDFCRTVRHFNRAVYARNAELLESLPQKVDRAELTSRISETGDTQLMRLTMEYLPVTFGRRHGDPSRPWNRFEIRLRDDLGRPLLSYEGNWRDIFQNWEALALSFPGFIEGFIARFVNASTADGYNPYRITKDGIDWEVEDLEDEWSYIGYWGDHQIIYLLKLLELSRNYHGDELNELLGSERFSYANVPYRIKGIDDIFKDAKDTIVFDDKADRDINRRVEEFGADAKSLLDPEGDVYLVNLTEKLLVPLLAKLSNVVIGGGVWLNTQRPEWNDANNAIVGNGLSMVTMCYMRRYVVFLRDLLSDMSSPVTLSSEVGDWVRSSADIYESMRSAVEDGDIGAEQRFEYLRAIGEVATQYRTTLYEREGFSGKSECGVDVINGLLDSALVVIEASIAENKRDDGLYNAYNIIENDGGSTAVRTLYPMLEGQVSALSSGALSPAEVISVIESLFESAMYRTDQESFTLYPDRQLPGFLNRNRISDELVDAIPLLAKMLEEDDDSVITRDVEGQYRFNSDLENEVVLNERLDMICDIYGEDVERYREMICQLYESVFNHQAFTGRSGSMFGFEGLGCIYWHMVSKLLLAVQENFFSAEDRGADAATVRRIGELYYKVRHGIGFNKTPEVYGAFPADPYSHTPGHAGARQPGMTGQVKEEIITRFGELGVKVNDGSLRFMPTLLRSREFSHASKTFRYLDVYGVWQELDLPADSLAFTYCQVPVTYQLVEGSKLEASVTMKDGESVACVHAALSRQLSDEVFSRKGEISSITIEIGREHLLE